ncbi:legumain [Trichuris trichiura]|uniref:legumain n=1 Tax=Trichuris trichiura TaxID=36087 RepID=A0A077YZ24_TRITR|nr:legumain [Trichuris trichiura]
MLPLLLHLLALPISNAQQSRPDGDSSSPKLWALLVAGSNEWYNYRHQADICHAYQILHKHGVPDDRIVVMMYDDIAYNKENIWKGKIINHPKGKDVYKGVPKDYTGKHVTPKNFRSILLGLKEEMRGIGSEKVIDSGPNDHIFVNFVDHGAHGILSFPTTEMTVGELNETLWLMRERNRYGKMLIYVEACESGSMFHSTLPRDIEIYATTAANGQESSYACFFDETLKTYLGDCYSVNWMEDSDRANLEEETIEQQFKVVKKETNTSHVKQYGDLSVAELPLSEFFGNKLLLGASPKYTMGKFWSQDAVSSRDVPLEILKRRMAHNSPDGRIVAFQYRHLLQKREYFHNFFKKLVLTMVDGSDVDPLLLFERQDISMTQLDCHTKMVHSFSELCFNFGKNPYAMKYAYVFVNICEQQLPVEKMLEKMRTVCSGEKRYRNIL